MSKDEIEKQNQPQIKRHQPKLTFKHVTRARDRDHPIKENNETQFLTTPIVNNEIEKSLNFKKGPDIAIEK
jgi:hypothetical protein